MRILYASIATVALSVCAVSAQAASFCGEMVQPSVDLKYLSRGFGGGHTGVDLMAPMGSPIRAAAGGTVVYAGWYFAYGRIVDIQHSDNVVTRYAHMLEFAPGLTAGTPVAAGQIIGQVGATGRARGSHVHFEVRVGGRAVDPKPYLAMARCPDGQVSEPVLEAIAPDAPPRRKRR